MEGMGKVISKKNQKHKKPDPTFWSKKKVLVTGHTGFKGSWLTIWLLEMGAEVFGISLEPTTMPNLFEEAELSNKIKSYIFDIRNRKNFEKVIKKIQPDIVFHMAAQPLVIDGYLNPICTWETNLIGTINLLNLLRKVPNKCACICVTTDKVYRNSENKSHSEDDSLGGFDPYSCSKAACELAIESFRSSFCGNLNYQKDNLFIASVRSGNVIGGGDWSKNRIIPDIIRSIVSDKKILIRSPYSIRPWQHVLDPLSGYLILAEKLFIEGNSYSTSYNFGPKSLQSNKKVLDILKKTSAYWKLSWGILPKSEKRFHESSFLSLNISKSQKHLNWDPKWEFEKTLEITLDWYKNYYNDKNSSYKYCLSDLENYLK